MKIKVDEKGILYVDDQIKEKDDINTELLETITNMTIDKNVVYELAEDETIPMIKLFTEIKNMCNDDSDFYKKIVEIRKKKNELEENLDEIVNQEISEDSSLNLVDDPFSDLDLGI